MGQNVIVRDTAKTTHAHQKVSVLNVLKVGMGRVAQRNALRSVRVACAMRKQANA